MKRTTCSLAILERGSPRPPWPATPGSFRGKPRSNPPTSRLPRRCPARPVPAIGSPLYAGGEAAAFSPCPRFAVRESRNRFIIPECHLAIIEKQDVPCQHDGVLLFIGTPHSGGEQVPADRILTVKIGSEEKKIRTLKEGDTVQAGQLSGPAR